MEEDRYFAWSFNMKRHDILCLSLIVLVTRTSALVYSRHEGLFPSFDDPYNTPTDTQLMAEGLGYVDDDPAFDPDGFEIHVEAYNYRLFDNNIKYITCFDTGFCECDPSAAITRTVTANIAPPGDPLSALHFPPGFCLFAPNWVIALNTGMEYKVAHRHVDATNAFQQQDIKLISADVNRFFDQWQLAWSAVYAEIITWKITESATGATDKFQVTIAKGNDDKTYILYLYETIGTFPTSSPVRGVLNGKYTGSTANVKSARVCSSIPGSEIVPINEDFIQNSNYRCGRKGVFLFPTEDGDECQGVDTCTVYETEVKPNCNRSSVPVDTCSESFNCQLNQNGDIVLEIRLKRYRWKSIKALSWTDFIGASDGGTVSDPKGVEVSVGPNSICRKDDLPHPGMNDPSVAVYTLTQPESSSPALCGTVIDTALKTISFVYKNYDYDPDIYTSDLHADVAKDGDVILYGTCHYKELVINISQSVINNGPAIPTILPTRYRQVTFDVTDRPSADGLVLTTTKVGRDIYLRVCFYPGTPFNRHADDFGVYVIDGMVANNPGFVTNLASYHRAQSLIQNSCPATPITGPFKLNRAFEADMSFSTYTGSGWCILTGKMDAKRWYTLNGGLPVTTLYFQVTIDFCNKEDGLGFGQGFEQQKCIDNCEADNSKRRRRRDTGNNEGKATLTTYVQLIEPIEQEPDNRDIVATEDGTSSTVSIVTIVVSVALVIFAIAICALLYLRLRKRRDSKEDVSVQDPYYNFYM